MDPLRFCAAPSFVGAATRVVRLERGAALTLEPRPPGSALTLVMPFPPSEGASVALAEQGGGCSVNQVPADGGRRLHVPGHLFVAGRDAQGGILADAFVPSLLRVTSAGGGRYLASLADRQGSDLGLHGLAASLMLPADAAVPAAVNLGPEAVAAVPGQLDALPDEGLPEALRLDLAEAAGVGADQVVVVPLSGGSLGFRVLVWPDGAAAARQALLDAPLPRTAALEPGLPALAVGAVEELPA